MGGVLINENKGGKDLKFGYNYAVLYVLITATQCCTALQLQRLQFVQNAAARLVTGTRRTEHITPVLQSLHWLPVRQRIVYKLATLIHKCLTGRAPSYLAEYCHQAGTRRPGTRSADTSMLDVPRTRTALGDRSFAVAGPRIYLEQSATQHS